MQRWAAAAVATMSVITATAGVGVLVRAEPASDPRPVEVGSVATAPSGPSATTTTGGTTTTTTTAAPSVPPPPPLLPATAAASGLPVDELRAAVHEWLAAHPEVPGVVVGVARVGPGGDVWTEDVDDDAPSAPDRDDVYGVLSMTKTFTEALVLREAAAGRIDLDAPMPPVAGVGPDAAITPRLLLQHASGLVDYKVAVGYDAQAPITPAGAVSLGLRSPRQSAPGTRAAYANTNFHWLGLLLEHVTGRPFADLVAEVAAEAGLADTSLGAPPRPGWVGFASGGLLSTVSDMARWGAALFTPGRVLDDASLSLLTTAGPLGVSHGLWPACPCDGGKPTALAQVVRNGGFVYLPARDAVVVVHLELGALDAAGHAVDLATALDPILDGATPRG